MNAVCLGARYDRIDDEHDGQRRDQGDGEHKQKFLFARHWREIRCIHGGASISRLLYRHIAVGLTIVRSCRGRINIRTRRTDVKVQQSNREDCKGSNKDAHNAAGCAGGTIGAGTSISCGSHHRHPRNLPAGLARQVSMQGSSFEPVCTKEARRCLASRQWAAYFVVPPGVVVPPVPGLRAREPLPLLTRPLWQADINSAWLSFPSLFVSADEKSLIARCA